MQPQQMVISAPLNDEQLRIFAASIIFAGRADFTPAQAVRAANEITAEIITERHEDVVGRLVAEKDPEFAAKQQAMVKEMQALAAAQARGLQIPVGALNPELLRRNNKGQA